VLSQIVGDIQQDFGSFVFRRAWSVFWIRDVTVYMFFEMDETDLNSVSLKLRQIEIVYNAVVIIQVMKNENKWVV
jgi:hypothetical protein